MLDVVICQSKEHKALTANLRKYRRTAVNTERDSEIMRLHREWRTAGQIVAALAARWELTDKQINAVISRQRRKLKD